MPVLSLVIYEDVRTSITGVRCDATNGFSYCRGPWGIKMIFLINAGCSVSILSVHKNSSVSIL